MMKAINFVLYCFTTCLISRSALSAQRCQQAPNWLVKGRNPILETAAEGNVVVLSLVTSKSRQFLLHTLDALDNYGRHYSYVVQQKVKILVINGQGGKLPGTLIDRFPYIKIYDEPEDTQVFKKLKGNAWDVLVYDVCGRMQFRYVYPYSWLGFPFLSRAINYAIGQYEHVCGKCKPLSEYRHLPAKFPPTISSSHVPAEVVAITANDHLAEGLHVTTREETTKSTTREEPTKSTTREETTKSTTREETTKSNTREETTKSTTKEETTSLKPSEEPYKRAHGIPIFINKEKKETEKEMKSGYIDKPITVAPKVTTGNTNDVRNFIVSRLNRFLNTKFATIVTTSASDVFTVDDDSMDEEGELGISTDSVSTPLELQDTNIHVTNALPVVNATAQKENKPTTEVPTTTQKYTTEDELNREIKEENKKLQNQIEKAENIIYPKTETKVIEKKENEKEAVKWESNLILDYILQNLASDKK